MAGTRAGGGGPLAAKMPPPLAANHSFRIAVTACLAGAMLICLIAGPAGVSADTPAEDPAPVEAPPAPVINSYWLGRARLIEIKYKLGGLFVRQIMQESRFENEVIYGQKASWAGAEGIAQIVREYHPWVNPLKPEAALDYAARHMLDLLLRFDGNVVKALAAYNAGVGTVEWAIEFAGDDWLSWMPWETQDYVSAIMLPGEQTSMPNWAHVKHWWSRMAERIERPLQLRLLQGRTIAVGALPLPPEPPADVAAEALPPSP